MPMFELMDSGAQEAIIKVIGVGGGGGNAVQHMVNSGINGVDFICTNTDAQALGRFEGAKSLQIGSNITKGWVQVRRLRLVSRLRLKIVS